MPVRKIPMNHRSVTGLHAGNPGEPATAFESTLERDLFTLLAFDLNVERYEEQPVRINYTGEDGKAHTYTPDALVTYRNDIIPAMWMKPLLIEVKYRQELRDCWRELLPKFRAAYRYARKRGWHFKILTEVEIRTPFLENAKFLLRYRREATSFDNDRQILSAMFELREATPEAVLAYLRKTPMAQAELLPNLWRLIALHEVGTDLTLPVTMRSRIWSRSPREDWSVPAIKRPMLLSSASKEVRP